MLTMQGGVRWIRSGVRQPWRAIAVMQGGGEEGHQRRWPNVRALAVVMIVGPPHLALTNALPLGQALQGGAGTGGSMVNGGESEEGVNFQVQMSKSMQMMKGANHQFSTVTGEGVEQTKQIIQATCRSREIVLIL